jgi:hypothetical protein
MLVSLNTGRQDTARTAQRMTDDIEWLSIDGRAIATSFAYSFFFIKPASAANGLCVAGATSADFRPCPRSASR